MSWWVALPVFVAGFFAGWWRRRSCDLKRLSHVLADAAKIADRLEEAVESYLDDDDPFDWGSGA